MTSQEGRARQDFGPSSLHPLELGLGLCYKIKVDNQLTLPLRSILNNPGKPNIITWADKSRSVRDRKMQQKNWSQREVQYEVDAFSGSEI